MSQRSTKEIIKRRRKQAPRFRWFRTFFSIFIIFLIIAVIYEIHTSHLQSRLFSYIASHSSYQVEAGPSPSIVFPQSGPFNTRRGYSQILKFENRFKTHGYKIVQQARFSPQMSWIAKLGITPPYPEPYRTGLVITDANGTIIYDAISRNQLFNDIEEIPPLITKTLLFIEDRGLDRQIDTRNNPVINWGRFFKACFLYGASKLGFPIQVEGGSTLATQLEKYRYSSDGKTLSPLDKLRQIVAASLKVYQEGSDTRPARKRIILDYINTMPLAAVPSYGEIYGLGEGLNAWFNVDVQTAAQDLTTITNNPIKAELYRQILMLFCAVRAPSYYLIKNPAALEKRTLNYLHIMENKKLIDPQFATLVSRTPVSFSRGKQPSFHISPAMRKASHTIRLNLLKLLDIDKFYDLNRLHLGVQSTIDGKLQEQIAELFEKLKRPGFIRRKGLLGSRLLSRDDIQDINYSYLLYERTALGNALRIQIDNQDVPFDMNAGMKLELGSTAKLRTLAHYLEIVSILFDTLSPLNKFHLKAKYKAAKDPITKWVAKILIRNPKIKLERLVNLALNRTYSANPEEQFFTGGGIHTFHNYDSRDDNHRVSVREATTRSVNLVFVRLLRDIADFHRKRLPYNESLILNQRNHPDRLRLLQKIATAKAVDLLLYHYRTFYDLSADEIINRLISKEKDPAEQMAILFYAWTTDPDESQLRKWLGRHDIEISQTRIEDLIKKYDVSNWKIKDYAYLLNKHPIELWCAGQINQNHKISWHEIVKKSERVRQITSKWLVKAESRTAQNNNLLIQFEKEAFQRMTPYWQKMGFPFKHIVPSLATALGSSGDRPSALAELMGIILNNGIQRDNYSVETLRLGQATPYETVFQIAPSSGKRIMHPVVTKALQKILQHVVEAGTAVRARNTISGSDGSNIRVGGKTGSGDNRWETFDQWGNLISSKVINRTATFVFFIGDRFFGVVNAFVPGEKAANSHFTSSLPLAIFKLSAPFINAYEGRKT